MDKRILRNTLWLLPIWVFLLTQLAYASLYEDILGLPSGQDMPTYKSSSDWINSKVEPLYNPEYPQIEPALPPNNGGEGDSTGIWGWLARNVGRPIKEHVIEPIANFFDSPIDDKLLNNGESQRSWEVFITYYIKPHTPEPMPLLNYTTERGFFGVPNQWNTYEDGTWHITAYTHSWVGLKNGLLAEHTWEADVVQGKLQGEVKYVGTITGAWLKAIGDFFKYNPQFPFREPFTE